MAATKDKDEVNYRKADRYNQRCGNCSMYRYPRRCTLVKGAISAGDVCDEWEKEK